MEEPDSYLCIDAESSSDSKPQSEPQSNASPHPHTSLIQWSDGSEERNGDDDDYDDADGLNTDYPEPTAYPRLIQWESTSDSKEDSTQQNERQVLEEYLHVLKYDEEYGTNYAERFMNRVGYDPLEVAHSNKQDASEGVYMYTYDSIDEDYESVNDSEAEDLEFIGANWRLMEHKHREEAKEGSKVQNGAQGCVDDELKAEKIRLSTEENKDIPRCKMFGMLDGNNPIRCLLVDEIEEMEDMQEHLSQVGIRLEGYQWKGINWMYCVFLKSLKRNGNLNMLHSLHESTPGPFGVCLADSVGLGKTLQAAATIRLIFRKVSEQRLSLQHGGAGWERKGKILIVVPSEAHQAQWDAELARVLGADVFSGSILRLNTSTVPLGPRVFDMMKEVFIATPALFQTQNEAYETMRQQLQTIRWACILVDEAHSLRNGAWIYKELKKLKSDFRIALTATPYANRPSNLACLFNFVAPGALGAAVGDDVEAMRQKVAACFLLGRRVTTPYQTHCFDVHIPLPDYERQRYDTINNTAFSDSMSKTNMLKSVLTVPDFPLPPLNVHGVAINPKVVVLYRYKDDDPNEIEVVEQTKGAHDAKPIYTERRDTFNAHLLDNAIKERELAQYTVENIMRTDDEFMSLQHDLLGTRPQFGAKMAHLVLITRTILAQGESVLIFCKKIALIHAIVYQLGEVLPEIRVGVIYGEVPPKARVKIVEDFNRAGTDMKVMILTYDTGGQGLNLPAANHVILYDLDFIYLQTEQAVGRVQRLKTQQRKDVYTYRFATPDTVDTRLAQIQDKKRSMNDLFLSGGAQSLYKPDDDWSYDAHHVLFVSDTFFVHASEDNSCKWQRIVSVDALKVMLGEQEKRAQIRRNVEVAAAQQETTGKRPHPKESAAPRQEKGEEEEEEEKNISGKKKRKKKRERIMYGNADQNVGVHGARW